MFSADFQKGLKAYQQGDYATALKEWKPLAEQGHADAQVNLGVMYLEGQNVPRDYKTAIKWLTLAAEQKHIESQYYVKRVKIFLLEKLKSLTSQKSSEKSDKTNSRD